MDAAIVQALLSLGPGGIMCWILLQQNKAFRDDWKNERAERLQFDRERLETDKGLVKTLTSLAMKITGRPFDGDAS